VFQLASTLTATATPHGVKRLPRRVQWLLRTALLPLIEEIDVTWEAETAIIPGTGVFESLFRIPIALIAYFPLKRQCGRRVHLVVAPQGGTGSLENGYIAVCRQLLAISKHGRINIIGHSQGAVHAVRFAAEHPDRVAVCISVGGPHAGSWLAALLVRVFGQLPQPLGGVANRLLACLPDMAPDSPFLQGIRTKIQGMMRQDLSVRPRICCISVGGERIVQGHSPFIEEADANIVLARVKPDHIKKPWVEFRQTQGDTNHVGALLNDEVLAVVVEQLAMGAVKSGNKSRRTRRTRRKGVAPVAPLGRAA
jgi:hypothetical protein